MDVRVEKDVLEGGGEVEVLEGQVRDVFDDEL